MKNLIWIILILSFLFEGCEKENSKNSNTNWIKGWDLDSISFNYDSISPEIVNFINLKTGYIIGLHGELLKTTDYAKTWTTYKIDTPYIAVQSMYFLDENIGFVHAVESYSNNWFSLLLKTIDGGKSWTKQYDETYSSFRSLRFFDEKNGISIDGWEDRICITNNGGKSWETVNSNIVPLHKGLYFLNNTCFAVDKYYEKIYKSDDFGKTWNSIIIPLQKDIKYIRDFYFINENIGYLNLVNDSYKTTDGGNSWQKINLPGLITHFCNTSEGIIIVDSSYCPGSSGSCKFFGSYGYTTMDGGINWEKFPFIKNLSFGLIDFVTDNYAYCIGKKYIYTLQKE